MINCALNVLNCDLKLSRVLNLTILGSNTSSRSTKVFRWPHNKTDSIYSKNFSIIQSPKITENSHTHKDEYLHGFTYKIDFLSNQHLFEITKDHNYFFNAWNWIDSKGMFF